MLALLSQDGPLDENYAITALTQAHTPITAGYALFNDENANFAILFLI